MRQRLAEAPTSVDSPSPTSSTTVTSPTLATSLTAGTYTTSLNSIGPPPLLPRPTSPATAHLFLAPQPIDRTRAQRSTARSTRAQSTMRTIDRINAHLATARTSKRADNSARTGVTSASSGAREVASRIRGILDELIESDAYGNIQIPFERWGPASVPGLGKTWTLHIIAKGVF